MMESNLLQIMSFGVAGAATIAAAKTFFEGMKGLRAKQRAEYHLHELVRRDAKLASTIRHAAASELTRQEIEAALRDIEVALSSMSEDDKKLVKEGLHQDSASGAQRYVRDLLNAAAT